MGYVYKITNLQTKKSYVGKTIKMNVKERFNQHVSNGRKIEGSSIIAKSLREYGTINHTIEILEFCEDNLLLEREQYWIEKLNTIYLGYNIKNEFIPKVNDYWGNKEMAMQNLQKGLTWNKGIIPSEKVRKQISSTKKKKYNLGLYENSYGHKHTEQTKLKLSKIAKSRSKPSQETRKKIGIQSKDREFYYSIQEKNVIFVKKGDIVPEGYQKGKGCCWVNKDGQNISIKIWEKMNYISNGYNEGRINVRKNFKN